MPFFGVPIRNGLPIGLGSVAGFGVQQFDPSLLFEGGTVPGAWYDSSDPSTMFTTSAGTTPVAMPGQGSAVSVGLMLDKSQGLVLGSELAGSILSGTSGWTFVGAATVSGGAVVFTTPPSTNASAQYNPIFSSGLWYRVQVTLTGTGQVNVQLGSAGTSATLVAPGSYTINGRASGGTPTVLTFSSVLSSVNNFVGSVTAISVRELPGNHAIAINDTTARPELRARVNLLTYSEEFQNAAWNTSAAGITVQANTIVAPNGTSTADKLEEDANLNHHRRGQLFTAIGVTGTFSVYAKAAERNFLRVWSFAGGDTSGRFFDLTTGVATGTSASMTDAGNGWWRCQCDVSSLHTTVVLGPAISLANGTNTYTGTAGSGIYIWGADLRPANIGANVPAYQRIADANTYDTNGFPLYLRFDGIDDGMYTPANLNLSATDKVGVFAGVRKLSDAARGMVAETSTTVGVFQLNAPSGAGVANYEFRSKGTLEGTASSPTSYPSPITNVLTGLGDISGDSTILRINGTQAASSTADQGTGNYGTYPLYIGSRANSSLWFNGHLHGLIIAGSAVSAGNISATESWMAGKTGLVLP